MLEVKDTPRACGRQYGEHHAEAIEAFLHLEATPNPWRLRYAARCWERLKHWEAHVVEFVRGMAEGSKLSVEKITLLLLHEEIAHSKHCTAIGATGKGTADGRPIIAQNWDWNSRLYPWPSLLRLRSDAMLAALHYTFPGLWAGAGINEQGMSLVWTSAGSIPKMKPQPGIPTYALIAGILACKDCQQALALLRRTKIAGFFIFIIADARGEVWVIEGWPGRLEAVRCEDVVTRANHYECETPRRINKLFIDSTLPEQNTQYRAERMTALAQRHRGKIDARRVEAFLCDEGVGEGKNICHRPSGTRRRMTLDSFYCLPVQREFWIARGIPTRHEFRRYRVS